MTYRLAWFGNRGVAQRGCRVASLRAAPDLGDGAVHELDFDPAHGVRIVRQRAVDERRDLRLDEEAAAIELCRAFHPSGPAPL